MSSFHHNYSNYSGHNVSSLNADGDDCQERLRLENTIQLREISFHSHESDVEFPRLLPDPHFARSYDSGIFIGATRDGGDDDNDEGYSLSTVAHHVNGITLSPGLAMHKHHTPTTSDFDASRPLNNIDFRKAKDDLSVFSHRPSRKHNLSSALHEQVKFSPKRPVKPSRSRDEKENQAPPSVTPNRSSRLRSREQNIHQRGIRLPDITGITQGVASPEKPPSPARSDLPSQQPIIVALERQLEGVTAQFDLSRQRVQVLEQELEKRDRAEQQFSRAFEHDRQGHVYADLEEAIREKEALASLVSTLRDHQERLESSLRDRQDELTQLRSTVATQERTISNFREKLSRTEQVLKERDILYQRRAAEIQRLRDEIARLERECVYLRGCVERSLESLDKDSRAVPPATTQASIPPASQQDRLLSGHRRAEPEGTSRLTPVVEESEPSSNPRSSWPPCNSSPTPPPRSRSRLDQTMQTHATVGEGSTKGTRFIDDLELSQLQLDLSERRSQRSHSSHSQSSLDVSPPQTSRRRQEPDVTVTKAGMPTFLPRPRTPSGMVASSSQTRPNVGQPQPHVEVLPKKVPIQNEPKHTDATPFPQIRGEHMERLFFSAPPHNEQTCHACHRRKRGSPSPGTPQWLRNAKGHRFAVDEGLQDDDPVLEAARYHANEEVPPQTVLAHVLRELEDDFAHYKSIYCELADQYKIIDAASNVAKRNVLAEHLTEVIRVLEKKGDQIASLYGLLTFKDKPRTRGNNSAATAKRS